MGRKRGWIEEVTYGTSPLAAPTTDHVYYWGADNFGWEHPWHDEPITPVAKAGEIVAEDIVRGENELKFPVKYCPVHAWQWIYGGLNTITDGGGGVYTFTPSNTVALRSRTGYFEEGTDYVEAQGLIVETLDLYFEQGKALVMEESLVGTSCKAGTLITHDPTPNWPASLNTTNVVGWSEQTTCTHNAVNMHPLRWHVQLHNVLQTQSGSMKAGAANYDVLSCKRSLMGVIVDMYVPFDNTANDFWALYKAATRDKTFHVVFTWNTSYYWDLTIANLRYGKPKVVIPDPHDAGPGTYYSIVATAYNNPITLVVKDGVTYS